MEVDLNTNQFALFTWSILNALEKVYHWVGSHLATVVVCAHYSVCILLVWNLLSIMAHTAVDTSLISFFPASLLVPKRLFSACTFVVQGLEV